MKATSFYPTANPAPTELASVERGSQPEIEHYVQNQLRHHPMADPRIQERFEWVQIASDDVDVSQIRYSAHGQSIYNLHVVLEHAEGWCAVDPAFLTRTHDMILKICRNKGFLLSRAGILANHLHLSMGCGIEDASEEVAMCFLNNPEKTGKSARPIVQNLQRSG